MNAMLALRTVLGGGLRIFFLCAGIYAVFAMTVWVILLRAPEAAGAMPFSAPPVLWHAHEMIFGYACAVLGGFFLTAMPSWTGQKSARAAFLTVLAGLWLAGRLAIWWSGAMNPVLVAVVDLAFLPALAGKLALQLIHRPKPQNLIFLGLIALMWSGNLLVHLDWTGAWPGSAEDGLRLALLAIATTISIIGGRVVPAFTRNAMLRTGREDNLPVSRRWLDLAGNILTVLLGPLIVLGAADALIAVLAFAAGGAQCARLAGWRTGWTLRDPIVWSLHLGFTMLSLGLIAIGAAYAGLMDEFAALHVVAVGAVGGMTLAMMSRAALGHTGRPLRAPPAVACAYGLIALSAIIRSVGTEALPRLYDWAMLISGALWILAFTLFLAAYWSILTKPRLERSA